MNNTSKSAIENKNISLMDTSKEELIYKELERLVELDKLRSESGFLERYILQKEIGKGSYGKVYRAINKLNGDVVAIKVISGVTSSPLHARSILREI